MKMDKEEEEIRDIIKFLHYFMTSCVGVPIIFCNKIKQPFKNFIVTKKYD